VIKNGALSGKNPMANFCGDGRSANFITRKFLNGETIRNVQKLFFIYTTALPEREKKT
jgi:hypothetical protein